MCKRKDRGTSKIPSLQQHPCLNMNYDNSNVTAAGFSKTEEERSSYIRSNNYVASMNESSTYSNKGNIQIEDNSNTHVYSQLRSKREDNVNVMVAGSSVGNRKFYDGNLNKDGYTLNIDSAMRNSENVRNYMNCTDKNSNGGNISGGNQDSTYKKKYGNANYNENQNNQKNPTIMQHQQKKSGGASNFTGSNLNKSKVDAAGSMPQNVRSESGGHRNDNRTHENGNDNMRDKRNENNNESNINSMNVNSGTHEKPRYKPPMLRNQGNFNRVNFGRMNYNKGGGGTSGGGGGGGNFGFNRHYNIPKTAWANRDNRRYYQEKEDEIYSNVKSEKGVNFELYDSIPVEIKGYNSENVIPIESFDDTDLNLHELLLSNIKKVNYDKTTPIQKYSLGIIMNRNDLIGVAQTGSGKTAGYLLPIINHMLLNDPPKHSFYEGNNKSSNYYYNRVCLPVCLILAPTRELAVQIFYDAKKFCFETGIRPVVLYGGSNIKTQLSNLDKGADIIVATPGRLNDILEKRKIKLFLTSFLVLDEADRMLDMGFSPQIRSIVNDYDMPGNDNDSHLSENKMEYKKYTCDVVKRQTIMFSATFRKEIQVLAKEYLCNYTFLLVGKVGSTNEYIKQNLVYIEEENKCNYLLKLLTDNNNGLTIIFVETKRKADIIERFLNSQKLNAVCIHGDKSQDERERALKLFKRGIKNMLVATDVAARGLDISNIKHVINFDLPSNIDDYIHRIGRTGRAGNIGIATSFVNDDNRNIFKDLLATLEECNQLIPRWFLNLVMRYTASAKFNRNYKYRSVKGRGGNYSRYNNNQGFTNNGSGNSNPFNTNNSYNQHSGFGNNNPFNSNSHMGGGGGNGGFSSNPFNNNMYQNNSGSPYNNSGNNMSPFNANKFNNNYNQKRFDDQNFQRGNFQSADDNGDGW
ncbi:DEAD/DEAH box helicase, putative [Plasmodium ovale wallikeri]|uniref:RNA helicase n=2 Tax=Plasmodium ovale TaxID=36330 RepID=A0A1A8ZY10_PLAOA|nr:DEAD/DEAH box helicase, putative [Plasmodium ovale wallikeri]SBT48774.1 DEAD/DEAH box helicase, putative [Plasmodium ovale wallikeri]SBT82448.1 ATP-dependent RNA helicase DBP1, putative [Plasmodium ovale]